MVTAAPASPKVELTFSNIGSSVKISTSNLFIKTTPDFSYGMQIQFFESLSATELTNLIPQYSLSDPNLPSDNTISNIASIKDKTSSYSLSKIQDLAEYTGFQLNKYVPTVGSGTNGAFVYFDNDNQNIVVETVNINNSELLKYEILTQGNVVNATM
jgi:hypothetical protein